MRVMLFGAAGQVGSDCANLLNTKSYELLPITRQQVDFASSQKVVDCVKQYVPDVVINACAYTAVDKAEDDFELANKVNHLSVGALAEVCAELNIPLIHISTDYVFDGEARTPYREECPVNPLGVYGQTKFAGEQALPKNHQQHIILRTSWVFGINGHNFVTTMLRLGKERESLGIVSDQRGCPTYSGDIAKVIDDLLLYYAMNGKLPWGIYHCACCDEVSWYEFACEIFEFAVVERILSQKPEVQPITSKEYPTPAPRPAYSVLDNAKLEAFLGLSMPSWKKGLSDLLSSMPCY